MTLAENVKQRRKARGWTQDELSQRTGNRVPQAHIAQIETGKLVNPKLETLRGLAIGLRCSVVDLLPEEDKHPKAA